MNLTNQSHPFRFPQSVRTLRWAAWKPRQRFSIARPGARTESERRRSLAKTSALRWSVNLNSANVGGAVPAATLAVASATTIAARSAPPTFSSALALRRTMKHLLGGHAKKAQMFLAGAFLQALWI